MRLFICLSECVCVCVSVRGGGGGTDPQVEIRSKDIKLARDVLDECIEWQVNYGCQKFYRYLQIKQWRFLVVFLDFQL